MIALDAGAALMLVLLLLIVGALIGVTAAGESIERVVVVRGDDDVGVLEDKLNHEVAAGRARSPRARDLLHRQAAHRPSRKGANG